MAPFFGLVLSHLHIEAMAVEPFIAVTFPFFLGNRGVYAAIAVIWIIWLVYILPLLSWDGKIQKNKPAQQPTAKDYHAM